MKDFFNIAKDLEPVKQRNRMLIIFFTFAFVCYVLSAIKVSVEYEGTKSCDDLWKYYSPYEYFYTQIDFSKSAPADIVEQRLNNIGVTLGETPYVAFELLDDPAIAVQLLDDSGMMFILYDDGEFTVTRPLEQKRIE